MLGTEIVSCPEVSAADVLATQKSCFPDKVILKVKNCIFQYIYDSQLNSLHQALCNLKLMP